MNGADKKLAFSLPYLVAISLQYNVGHDAGYEDTGLFSLGGMICSLKHGKAMDLSVSRRSCTQIILGADQAGGGPV